MDEHKGQTGAGREGVRRVFGVYRAFLRESANVFRRSRGRLLIGTILTVLLVLLLWRFDPVLRELVRSPRDRTLRNLAQYLSWWGDYPGVPLFFEVGAVALGWIFARRRWILAAVACVHAALCGAVATHALKAIASRPRPSLALEDRFHWFELDTGFGSMPSGHATHCFAIAIAASMVLPRLRLPALAFATCVAWARLYLDRHYVTDLLVGAWIGGAAGWVFGLGARRAAEPLWAEAARDAGAAGGSGSMPEAATVDP